MPFDLDPQRFDLESIVLAPLGGLYLLGWLGYEAVYRAGLKKPYCAHVPVVVIGNLTVGGMGKTPLTLATARTLRELGYPVVLGASGYGSPKSQAAQIAPEGPLDAREWGDEPAFLRWLLPDFPLIVGRRRVLAAQLAEKHFPDHVLLMDDGVQHKPLAKDLTILIDPPRVANGQCLPAGPYREPRWHRRRADILIPDDYQLESPGLQFLNPYQPVAIPAESPAPAEIQVLCAIAKPYRYTETLAAYRYQVVKAKYLRDHDPIRDPRLLADFDPKLPLFTTGKDWTKLQHLQGIDRFQVFVSHYEVEVLPNDLFRSHLKTKLDEIKAKKRA